MTKKMNKQERGFYNGYLRSTHTELHQAYRSASGAKWDAWNNCKYMQAEDDGFDMRITGACCHTFSCAYKYRDDENKLCLCYITKEKVRRFRID